MKTDSHWQQGEGEGTAVPFKNALAANWFAGATTLAAHVHFDQATEDLVFPGGCLMLDQMHVQMVANAGAPLCM